MVVVVVRSAGCRKPMPTPTSATRTSIAAPAISRRRRVHREAVTSRRTPRHEAAALPVVRRTRASAGPRVFAWSGGGVDETLPGGGVGAPIGSPASRMTLMTWSILLLRRRGGELAQLLSELGDVLEALLRFLAQAALNDRLQSLRQIGAMLRQRNRRQGEDGGAQLRQAVAIEGQAPRKQLVEHDTDGPHVRPSVDVPRGAQLLGGHVDGRPEPVVGLGRASTRCRGRSLRRELGDAEVEDLHHGFTRFAVVTNRLSGFRSRWTTPATCASASASQVCRT